MSGEAVRVKKDVPFARQNLAAKISSLTSIGVDRLEPGHQQNADDQMRDGFGLRMESSCIRNGC